MTEYQIVTLQQDVVKPNGLDLKVIVFTSGIVAGNAKVNTTKSRSYYILFLVPFLFNWFPPLTNSFYVLFLWFVFYPGSSHHLSAKTHHHPNTQDCFFQSNFLSLPPTHTHTCLFAFYSVFYSFYFPVASFSIQTHTNIFAKAALHLLSHLFPLPLFSYHYFHALEPAQRHLYHSISYSLPAPSLPEHDHTFLVLSSVFPASFILFLPPRSTCVHKQMAPAVQLPRLPAGLGQPSSFGLSGPSGVQCPRSAGLLPAAEPPRNEHTIFKRNLYASKALLCVR